MILVAHPLCNDYVFTFAKPRNMCDVLLELLVNGMNVIVYYQWTACKFTFRGYKNSDVTVHTTSLFVSGYLMYIKYIWLHYLCHRFQIEGNFSS